MITEPVTCSTCGAVSVNGGTIHCHGCYTVATNQRRILEDRVARLERFIIEESSIVNDWAAKKPCGTKRKHPMKTCGTCKFRGPEITKCTEETDWEDVPTGFFQCQRIKHDERLECPNGEGAVVHDGSGYIGKLCVENDFGCTKHEPQA